MWMSVAPSALTPSGSRETCIDCDPLFCAEAASIAASLARFTPPMLPDRNWPEASEAGGVSAEAAIGAESASAAPSELVAAIAATFAIVLCAERWDLPVDGVLWLNTAGTFLILGLQDEEAEIHSVGVDLSAGLPLLDCRWGERLSLISASLAPGMGGAWFGCGYLCG
jgi:hypothetical protein